MPETEFTYGYKKFFAPGQMISRGALAEIGMDQERWHITSAADSVAGSSTEITDVYTVASGKTLQVIGMFISTEDASTVNLAYAQRKSGSTYYSFTGGYFQQNLRFQLSVPYQIDAGESLAVSITNNNGSAKNFVYSFNGFLHSKR